MILLVDNYDSFVFNLARYFVRLGQEAVVVRNDRLSAADVADYRPRALVLSPGPCAPAQAGCSLEVVRQWTGRLPILGVCLGHQAIAEALGGRVVPSARPQHGRGSWIHHQGRGVLTGISTPFFAGRYHSLVVDEATLPAELEITARTAGGVPMALEHRSAPVVGWQFHPESILTQCGYELLAAFLRRAGCPVPARLPSLAEELDHPPAAAEMPPGVVTF